MSIELMIYLAMFLGKLEFLLALFLVVFAAIAAVDISKKVIESKGVQTLYDKTYKLIENKLDEQLENK